MSTVADLPAHTVLDEPRSVVEAGEGGWRATMAFRCAYADRVDFIDAVSGVEEVIELSPGGPTITRVVPLQHPDFANLYATGFRAEGFGQRPGVAGYTDCRVQVEFANVASTGGADRPYMDIDMDHGGTYTTVHGDGMRFGDGTPVEENHGLFVAEQGYQVTTHFNPELDDAVIDTLVGKVNSAAFLGKAIGCVRFNGCKSHASRTTGNQTTYSKSFSFTFRAVPWNMVLRSGMTWDTIYDVGSGATIHQLADLNLLL